jgi:hypothetical protein
MPDEILGINGKNIYSGDIPLNMDIVEVLKSI